MNRYNRSQISAGIFIVVLGLLFLLNNMGIISHFNWRLLFQFWPVFIILIGLNLILRNTPLWWITSIIIILVIIYLFIANDGNTYYHNKYRHNFNRDFRSQFYNEDGEEIYHSQLEMEQDIDNLKLEINFSSGRLFLGSLEDDYLYELNSLYWKNPPQLNYSINEDGKTANLKIKQDNGISWFNISGKNKWKLNITPFLSLFININVGAGDFNFDLEDLKIEELIVNSGAGNLEIGFGNYARLLKVNSAAAKIKLKIPENKAVSIKTSGLISNNNFTNRGLIKKGDNTYQSANFNSKVDKMIIEINAPASNISLDFYQTTRKNSI